MCGCSCNSNRGPRCGNDCNCQQATRCGCGCNNNSCSSSSNRCCDQRFMIGYREGYKIGFEAGFAAGRESNNDRDCYAAESACNPCNSYHSCNTGSVAVGCQTTASCDC